MNELEQQLLQAEVGAVEPRLCLRTRTRIDAGRWGRRTPVWLCVVADELVLLAVARRRYLERVPLAACRESYYCPMKGQLVIAPVEGLRLNRFALSPREALQAMAMLGVGALAADDLRRL